MKIVFALEDDAVLAHWLQTDNAGAICLTEFNLYFLGCQNQQQGSAYLGCQLLQEVASIKQGVTDPYHDEVGADQQEHKLIEKYGFASPCDHQLEYQQCRDCPLAPQDCYNDRRLPIHQPAHQPVEQR